MAVEAVFIFLTGDSLKAKVVNTHATNFADVGGRCVTLTAGDRADDVHL